MQQVRPRTRAGAWRARASVALLVLATALQGCTLSWLYDHAEWLVVRQVHAFVELTTPQEEWLHGAVREHLQWHRRAALPVYVRLVEGVRRRAADGLDARELAWIEAAVTREVRVMTERLLPDLARLLTGLSGGQLDVLVAAVDADREDRREPLAAPPEERVKQRAERLADAAEGLVGTLDDAQTALIRQASEELPLEGAASEAATTRSEDRLLELLRGGRKGEVLAHLRAWLLDAPVRPSEGWKARARRLVLDLDASLTPAQRRTALHRLGDIADELARLHHAR